jgi:hypothetical protein
MELNNSCVMLEVCCEFMIRFRYRIEVKLRLSAEACLILIMIDKRAVAERVLLTEE